MNYDKIIANVNAVLNEIKSSIQKREFEKAKVFLEKLIEETEANPLYPEDSEKKYFSFDNIVEFLLYVQKFNDKKDVEWVQYPYSEIYYLYGSLLIELGNMKEANKVLEKAIRWNPMSPGIYFEYGETWKKLGDMEKFLEVTKQTFKLAYTRKHLARAYRNLGYYYIEQQDYVVANGCYIWSLQYERDSESATSELYYIYQMVGGQINPGTMMKELHRVSEEEGFPLEVDKETLGIILSYAQRFLEEEKVGTAKELFGIAYELTQDKCFEEILNDLKKVEA